MKERIMKLFPEIDWIQDSNLKEKVIATLEDGLKMGGWEPEDMEKLPFTLLIPDCPASLLTHFRGVVRIAKQAMDEFNSLYDYKLDNDIVIAGAVLHDVGKLVEYMRDENGKVVKSPMGKDLRHPFSGVGIAMKNDIPTPICHCIAVHASEGDGRYRSPEAVVINKADFLNFETLKSFLGLL